jgi:hypothetical protein
VTFSGHTSPTIDQAEPGRPAGRSRSRDHVPGSLQSKCRSDETGCGPRKVAGRSVGDPEEPLPTLRDPANSILIVNVTTGAMNTAVSGVPFRPSSVAVQNLGQILICSDSVIEEITFAPFLADGPLLMGIGNIPAQYVNGSTGLATTPAGSLCHVINAPFGGTLPIMVNYQSADSAGAAFYQVLVDGAVQASSWTVFHWNGSNIEQITVPPKTVGGSAGCFPVHPVSELFDYQPTALGYLLDSTALSNGLHTVHLRFVDSSGDEMRGANAISRPLVIMVNNQSCVAAISPPSIGTQTASAACGTLQYGTDESLTATFLGFATVESDQIGGDTCPTLTHTTFHSASMPPTPCPVPASSVN